MHRPQFFLRLYSRLTIIDNKEKAKLKKLRMLNLLITLEIIVNYSCTMHREYHDFNSVHVYLRSICISLL